MPLVGQTDAMHLQDQARKVFEQRVKDWDSEVSILEHQRKALTKGGSQAGSVVKQVATWQASMPQAEQVSAQLPKGVMSFPVLKTRAASAMHSSAEKGSAKKKVKEGGADLQRTQAKNPVQVCYVLQLRMM